MDDDFQQSRSTYRRVGAQSADANAAVNAGSTAAGAVAGATVEPSTAQTADFSTAPALPVVPVVVVGAGPVGLTLALDLAQQGTPVVVLAADDRLASGSRAICFAKRTLEIFDRLGVADPMVAKGVRWQVGKVFVDDALVYSFDLQAESGHGRPAFINLQQYYVEGFLAGRAAVQPGLDLRWHSRVVGIDPDSNSGASQSGDSGDADSDSAHVTLRVDTPEGEYGLRARYVVAADGSKSTVRRLLGLETQGRVFKDRFLIADVRMKADFPTERWFWFDPPFHRGYSVLLHRQPDNVWRIDFQLGWDVDPLAERAPERVIPRVRALLGPDIEFELVWVSVYTFACQRMASFRHGRVLFAGDSAHGVSPFGARGANSGVQDADNLAWKLRLVISGLAPPALLDSYAREREAAADENILQSTRASDFITPKSAVSRLFRDATLGLSRHCAFARRLVNSGRLSTPAVLRDSALNTADSVAAAMAAPMADMMTHVKADGIADVKVDFKAAFKANLQADIAPDAFAGAMVPGAAAADAPIVVDGDPRWFLGQLASHFTGVLFIGAESNRDESSAQASLVALRQLPVPIETILVTMRAAPQDGPSARPLEVAPSEGSIHASAHARTQPRADAPASIRHIEDRDGLLAARFDARPGTFYLLRPDQHVCARWRRYYEPAVLAALDRALGKTSATASAATAGVANAGKGGVATDHREAVASQVPVVGGAVVATSLTSASNLSDPDAFYEALIDTHQGLSDQESSALNARLILLLANHIGDATILRDALMAARRRVD